MEEGIYARVDSEPTHLHPVVWHKHKTIHVFRTAVTLVLWIIFLTAFLIFGVEAFWKTAFYLTQWGYMLTMVYFTINAVLFYDEKPTYKLGLLYHLSLSIEAASCVGYWTVIFRTQSAQYSQLYTQSEAVKISTDNPFAVLYLSVLEHILPVLLLAGDFIINKIVLRKEQVSYLFALLAAYFAFNFIAVYFFGVQVYRIITYTDMLSYLLVASFALVALLCWHVLTRLQAKKFRARQRLPAI